MDVHVFLSYDSCNSSFIKLYENPSKVACPITRNDTKFQQRANCQIFADLLRILGRSKTFGRKIYLACVVSLSIYLTP